MVIIRLARGGRTKRPFYHIVVTDSRNPRDGSYIERLGFHNSVAVGKEVALQIAEDRVNYWVSQGAKTSKQVQNLLKKAKNGANSPKKTEAQAEAA
ncbi:30S ribosomal protein S16 [Rickettsiella endosymbiont of Rhagonycha lignosa]|uniref:30S ribosomal protein S16 n=1 Tax=Rickettsiella endosymbiont of Rhagonycha lignosa TaxID=3077937 RepID=UPI00313BD5A1